MFKDPVVIDTDGQLDSFWGLVLAKRFLDVKAVTVCGGKNNNPEDAFKVPTCPVSRNFSFSSNPIVV